MREHKKQVVSLLKSFAYGYVQQTYPGFSTTLTNCVFQGRKQILSNSSRQTQLKTKKENETFDFIFSIMSIISRQKPKRNSCVKVQTVRQTNLKIGIRRAHFRIQLYPKKKSISI